MSGTLQALEPACLGAHLSIMPWWNTVNLVMQVPGRDRVDHEMPVPLMSQ